MAVTDTFLPLGGPEWTRALWRRLGALPVLAVAVLAAGCADLPVAPDAGDPDVDLALPWIKAAPSAVGSCPHTRGSRCSTASGFRTATGNGSAADTTTAAPDWT